MWEVDSGGRVFVVSSKYVVKSHHEKVFFFGYIMGQQIQNHFSFSSVPVHLRLCICIHL